MIAGTVMVSVLVSTTAAWSPVLSSESTTSEEWESIKIQRFEMVSDPRPPGKLEHRQIKFCRCQPATRGLATADEDIRTQSWLISRYTGIITARANPTLSADVIIPSREPSRCGILPCIISKT